MLEDLKYSIASVVRPRRLHLEPRGSNEPPELDSKKFIII